MLAEGWRDRVQGLGATMDIGDLKKRLTDQGVIIRYDDHGHAYVSVPVGKVPLKQFQEWQSRCDADFGGNRWLCIWTDFLRQKSFDAKVEAEVIRQECTTEKKEDVEDDRLGTLSGE